jgi:uncharacterized membrane protein
MHDSTMWLIPLSLIPGIAILIISTSLKNNQARSEIFQLIMENKDSERKSRMINNLKRHLYFRNAFISFYISIVLLVLASLIGTLTNKITNLNLLTLILICLAALCVVYASIQLILESLIATHVVKESVGDVRN